MILNIKKLFDIKTVVFLIIIIISLGTVSVSFNDTHETDSVALYFVDAEMLRLMRINAYMVKTTPQREANAVIGELIKGRDENPKIRRLISSEGGCLSVKVKKKTAYVDIKKEMAQTPPESRDLEILIVYQIVNSLTSIEGIDNVRFTVEGETKKDFGGFVDMRETFIPDYFV